MGPIERSGFRRFIDSLLFPIRGLFFGTHAPFGLISMRDERMSKVAEYCNGRVLDIGCGPGNLFIKNFIGEENGLGIDIHPYSGVENLVEDMSNLPFEDNSFDTVTLVAVGGHIPKQDRVSEFAEFARVLKPGGRLIMTGGEPITQYLRHKWLEWYTGHTDVDSERGMKEGEEYCMPKREIYVYLNTPPLRLLSRDMFQWRLNSIYVAEKQ